MLVIVVSFLKPIIWELCFSLNEFGFARNSNTDYDLLMSESTPEKRLIEMFGKGVKVARLASNLTQEAITERMQARGFPFYQATIYKIENGLRKTPVTEAVALAEILGYSVEELASGGEQIGVSPLDQANRKLSAAATRTSAAIRDQVVAMLDITRAAEEATELSERDQDWLNRGLLSWTPAWLGAESFFLADAILNEGSGVENKFASKLLDFMFEEFEAVKNLHDDG